ncbi:hypothetical protein LCGC14_0579690 [marine sediment metagenome]|uniref:Uncharacterized protein n=1 Tax=marine sediment metagenome TaxID=412755 RepID=A0A0F9S0A4_9ZZZZ
MAKYKLVNQNDGNDEIELGEFLNDDIAAGAALNQLGWSLVKEEKDE